MQYVYKYVEKGTVKYIGITNNMSKRFYQHTKDKLNTMDNPDVYYFPVKYRADAEMLETYLINYYGTGKFFNISKTCKGDVSFLDICDKLPWTIYLGNVDDKIKPFTVSDVQEIVYEPTTVYIDNESDNAKIQKIFDAHCDLLQKLDSAIKDETENVKYLKTLLSEYAEEKDITEWYSFVERGLFLHKKRLQAAMLAKRCLRGFPYGVNWERFKLIKKMDYKYCLLTEEHEGTKLI